MAAALVETAEHFVIFQTQYLDADDQPFESADEQIAEDYADPVGIAALRAGELQYDLDEGRVADSECTDTDEGDRV